MNEYTIHITKHAYKRYRQRVGAMNRRSLHRRSQTALRVGLYSYGEGLIKLCGIWWGCVVQSSSIVLTTCYGRQDRNMILARTRKLKLAEERVRI